MRIQVQVKKPSFFSLRKGRILKNLLTVLLFSLIVIPADTSVSYSATYSVIRLTENSYIDHQPQIGDDGQAVWVGDDEIFLYDGSTVIQLTDDADRNSLPRISSDGHVVWVGGDDPAERELFLNNGSTTIPLTNNDYLDTNPHVNGNYIVWQGRRGGDQNDEMEIFLYDGITQTQLTNDWIYDHSPQVNANGGVIWVKGDGPRSKILLYYNGFTIKQLSSTSYPADSPRIGDSGQIVWQSNVWPAPGWEIFLYDGVITRRLTHNVYDDRSPQINADGNVVWYGFDGSDYEIFLYNGSAIIQLTDNPYDDIYPQLNDAGYVVWQGHDGNDWEIFLYDGPEVVQLTDNAYDDGSPNHSYDRGSDWAAPRINANGDVIWAAATGGSDWAKYEIFLAILSDSTPPLADAGDDMRLRSENQKDTMVYGSAVDPDGDSLTYRWRKGEIELSPWRDVGENADAVLELETVEALAIGEHLLVLEVSDGQSVSSDEMTLVIENSAPHAAPANGGTYQIGDPVILRGQIADFDGDQLRYEWLLGDEVMFDGTVETPGGSGPVELQEHLLWGLDIGPHILTLRVADEYNTPVSRDIDVEVVDTEVPTLTPTADKTLLWPPNHQMVDITITANADNNVGQPVAGLTP